MATRTTRNELDGRTLWIPPMTYVGARLAAAVFRGIGIDARITPPSDERTLELGGLYSSGEECYPQKVTIGDFLRVIHSEDFDPDKTAFFMPIAEGPCRFGQYAPYFKQVLGELGHEDIPVISPSSKNSYDEMGEHGSEMIRTLWRGLVASDILRKMLLKTRPYETEKGAADNAFERSIELIEEVLESQGLSSGEVIDRLVDALI
ncbi:MAG: CoA protein activase, partial [Planctomycetota bacterium]